MSAEIPSIDPYLFELQFKAFKSFVEAQYAVPFCSFASHPYTEEQEGYKDKVHSAARNALVFQAWKKSDIGKGEIISATLQAIEIPQSNLVPWQAKFGKEARPQQPLYSALADKAKTKLVETVLFDLYHGTDDGKCFTELIDIFGKTYPLLAYLFFLKDKARYLPIAPTSFDRAFELLGARFKTTKRCSWQNYNEYLRLIGELKTLLIETLGTEVSLLDAHSFAWILAVQMAAGGNSADIESYLSLSATERDAIVKARIGQGKFRSSLIEYWKKCAVTRCSEPRLLVASHIKPWSKGTLKDRMSLYNGLLLSPTLDACFDSGLISFDDAGKILLSPQLTSEDLKALSLNADMCLFQITQEHKGYLAFHRENQYKSEPD